MEIIQIKNLEEAKAAVSRVGATAEGVAIMAPKALFLPLSLKGVDARAANLLKQTFLSKGGEAAISAHCADLSEEKSDVLLLGTLDQYEAALPVLKKQPWGLKKIAAAIETYLKNFR